DQLLRKSVHRTYTAVSAIVPGAPPAAATLETLGMPPFAGLLLRRELSLSARTYNPHHEAMSTTSTPVMITLVPVAPTRDEAAAGRTWRVCAGSWRRLRLLVLQLARFRSVSSRDNVTACHSVGCW